jgi:ATP-binding cassette subfamily B protein
VTLLAPATMLRRYLRPQATRVWLLAGLLLAAIGLQLANPQIIRYFLDNVQSAGRQSALLAAAGLFLAFALAQQVLTVISAYASGQVAWTATNALRRDLTLHCLQLDLDFHKSHSPGELIERIDGDTSTLGSFFAQLALQIAANLLLVLGILVLLFREDWRVGLALAAYTGLTLALLALIQPLAIRRWGAARQSSAELYGYIEERLAGAEDLRAAGAIPYAIQRLLRLLQAALVRIRAAFMFSTLLHNFTNVLSVLGYAFGLSLGVYLYTRGEATIGAAYLIVAYTGMLAAPLHALREQLRDYQPAAASLQRLGELFALRPAVADPPPASARPLPPGPLSVAVEGVTFNYAGDDAVLHDVSFQVAPGRVLGLLGRTGSGKSTLTRLLFRLYDPAQGRLLLGPSDLRAVPLAELRARVGLVTQDVQLFAATLRDNLSLFDPAVSDAALTTALQSLGLWEWVQALPAGLDTRLAAEGEGLSAGEAQLLALARVRLKDPGLIVLDEASSRLDPATEARLEHALDGLFAGRTGVIIAHRLRTVQRADDILILEAGRVVEFGPRAALAADPQSRFAHLLRTGLEAALA